MKNITVEEEYKKNPEISREDVQEILDWVATQPHLPKMNGEQKILDLQCQELTFVFQKKKLSIKSVILLGGC